MVNIEPAQCKKTPGGVRNRPRRVYLVNQKLSDACSRRRHATSGPLIILVLRVRNNMEEREAWLNEWLNGEEKTPRIQKIYHVSQLVSNFRGLSKISGGFAPVGSTDSAVHGRIPFGGNVCV